MKEKTKALIRVLDGQLIVLNTEGFRSEMNIYHYTEEESEFYECWKCDGEGYLCFGEIECPLCEGDGEIEEVKTVPHKDVEIESNIFL